LAKEPQNSVAIASFRCGSEEIRLSQTGFFKRMELQRREMELKTLTQPWG
jgi:hypothetical protein